MSLFSKILNLVRGAPVEVPVSTGVYRSKPKVAPSSPARVEVIEGQVAQPVESTPITRDEYRDLNIELAYKDHPLKVDPPKEPYPEATGLAQPRFISGLLHQDVNPSGQFSAMSGTQGWKVLPSGDPGVFCATTGVWVPMTSTCVAITGSVSFHVDEANPVRRDLFNALSPREQRELLDFFRGIKTRDPYSSLYR